MDTEHTETQLIKKAKSVIKETTEYLSKEVRNIRKTSDENCIVEFENILYNDYSYYEKLFFNEERFAERVRDVSGYFNYGELCDEINEYIKVYVWYSAWIKWVDGEL